MSSNTIAQRVIAIIGTAGRDTSKPMTHALWEAMCDDLHSRLTGNEHLISGGAAWADHLAVHAYYCGWVNELTLYLPAPIGPKGFIGPQRSAASAANYYHQRFSQAIGLDTIAQLHQITDQPGVTVYSEEPAPGYGAMFARNKKVARNSTGALAYTFGVGEQPADGGTLHTWQQINGAKTHVDLNALIQRWQDTRVEQPVKRPAYSFS